MWGGSEPPTTLTTFPFDDCLSIVVEEGRKHRPSFEGNLRRYVKICSIALFSAV